MVARIFIGIRSPFGRFLKRFRASRTTQPAREPGIVAPHITTHDDAGYADRDIQSARPC
jgi:hypothetical protein